MLPQYLVPGYKELVRVSNVLDAQGQAIAGLYAAGNDMNSMMGGHYPSGGITLGPAMTFGFIAAQHAAGRQL